MFTNDVFVEIIPSPVFTAFDIHPYYIEHGDKKDLMVGRVTSSNHKLFGFIVYFKTAQAFFKTSASATLECIIKEDDILMWE